MKLEHGREVPASDLQQLYRAVGWTTYAEDLPALVAAVKGSHHVVTAWEDGKLIGLARCVSDGISIAYIQDILVEPGSQRRGLGRRLVEDCLSRYAQVRQKVLLTDDRPEQLAFYESLGFSNTRELKTTPLNAFVIIDGTELS